jgi:hypothetical protein
MSRTFRRPGAEQLVNNNGGKIAGVYTAVDHYERTGNGHGGYAVYREPTKSERFDLYKRLHGDKGYYRFESMKRWERREENRCHRLRNKRLINNFLKGKTDDVVALSMPRNPPQYW